MPVERLRKRDLSSDERADFESALKTAGNYFYESRRLISLSLVCVARLLTSQSRLSSLPTQSAAWLS